jgi:hypothetical protein
MERSNGSVAQERESVRDIAFEAEVAALMGMTRDEIVQLRDEARADIGHTLHEYANGCDWIAVVLLAQLAHDRLRRIARDGRPLAVGVMLAALWPLMPGGDNWRSWLAEMVARIDAESGRELQPETA